MHESGFNFIVGIGRSGTTLLMSINSHPSIQATPEVNFFNFFYHSWKDKTNFSESDFLAIEVYVKSFDKKKKVTGFSWDMNLFKDKILKARKIDFQIIYSIFYSCFSYSNSHKIISHNFDKNPINTLMLQEIIDTLPNAKFICLVRDPGVNYLSRKEKAKETSQYLSRSSKMENIQ
ncbi:MAG: sulfotransferase [Bacteroidetes bacterium]|nr:sulfotransferase [Bacteroidota bacterium]